MRSIVLAPAFLIFGSFALAQNPARVDLDRPGVLNLLEQQHPQRYQAVIAVLRASEHAPCKAGEIELLKTQFNIKDLECGMLIFTSYPAKRHVSFELDGVNYSATVDLNVAETIQPASFR